MRACALYSLVFGWILQRYVYNFDSKGYCHACAGQGTMREELVDHTESCTSLRRHPLCVLTYTKPSLLRHAICAIQRVRSSFQCEIDSLLRRAEEANIRRWRRKQHDRPSGRMPTHKPQGSRSPIAASAQGNRHVWCSPRRSPHRRWWCATLANALHTPAAHKQAPETAYAA